MSAVCDIVLAIGIAVVILGLTAAAMPAPRRERTRGPRSLP